MSSIDPQVGVVIGTYGDINEWEPLVDRACASVEAQSRPAAAVAWVHADTLQRARNTGAEAIRNDCDHLVFLDADDELDEHYLEAMAETQSRACMRSDAKHFVIRPATLGIAETSEGPPIIDELPVMIPERDIKRSNYIVIGAMSPTDLFFEVGGFGDYPILEDWALWRAMVAKGAVVLDAPDAIYKIHVRPGSRNSNTKLHGEVYQQILKEVPL